jgi:hypothetical protein
MSNLDRNPGPSDNNNKDWTTVKHKKALLSKEKLEEKLSSMIKTKITVMFRVPSNAAADFSAAEVHFATIREISKQDANLLVLDNKGTSQVNIHKSFGQDKYKELFHPREKTLQNGDVQVSVAHYVLSENSSFNKALLIPFLKKHNAYVFFNQKDGLEHFAAIGVLFGPHPELAWRQSITEKLEKTIHAEVMTSGDAEKLKSTSTNPNIVVSLVPQQISNPKFGNTKSIALEVRVPADHETTYIEILDRLNERTATRQDDDVDIFLDESIGTFFPYYAKRSKSELFDLLMRKQNFAMSVTSAIPIFGYTQQVRDFELEYNGMEQSVQSIIWQHPNILAIEPTPSTSNLGKYIMLVDREGKDEVEEYIDTIFEKIPEMEGQPEFFKKPQRGGKPPKKNRMENISNFLKKLEESVAMDQLLTDEDSEYSVSPPTRRRRPTISYAQATKRLSFQNETVLGLQKDSNEQTNNTMITTMSTLTQNSLDAAIQQLWKETEKSISDLRQEMRTKVKNMEQSIAATVIAAIQSTQPINMEVENAENRSVGSASQDTTTTIKSMMDRFDALTQVVQNLAIKITEISEAQELNKNKRSRSPTSKAKDSTKPPATQTGNRSPPTKVPRPMAPTPPSTPPPKGQPELAGAQGGK